MQQIKIHEWIIHALLILGGLFLLNYPAFDLTYGTFRSGDFSLLLPSVLGTVFNIILFYSIAFYLIPNTLKSNGIAAFVVKLSILFLGITGIEILIDSLIISYSNRSIESLFSDVIATVLITHSFFLIIAFAYRFSKDWFENEKQRRSINEWQLRTELQVLKSQINPHFLFNALNNLFSMSLQHGDEKTAEGISKLSEMMRYVFDKSSKEWVILNDEVSYIKDYNHLQLLRFGENVTVDFNTDTFPAGIKIAPMLLIPFVENAFKYGVTSNRKTKVEITLTASDKTILFVIKNDIVEHKESISSSGVGIENVKKRLKLIYPDNHSLEISPKKNSFEVALTLMRI